MTRPSEQLCALTEIPVDPEAGTGAKGFTVGTEADVETGAAGRECTVFVVRRQGQDGRDDVFAYRNACPHAGTQLDWAPDKFLTFDRRRILCATHGAEFRIEDGLCVRGPCKGQHLEAIPAAIEDGMIALRLP